MFSPGVRARHCSVRREPPVRPDRGGVQAEVPRAQCQEGRPKHALASRRHSRRGAAGTVRLEGTRRRHRGQETGSLAHKLVA